MGEGPDTSATGHTNRTRMIAWGAGTIIVLALVMFGASALSSPSDHDEPSGPGSAPQASSADTSSTASVLLYERALIAEKSGDTSAAIDLAEEAVDADPANDKAVQLLVTLKSGDSAGGSTGSSAGASGSSATPTGTSTVARVKNIGTLLPAKIAQYSLDAPTIVGKDAVVSADPASGAPDGRSITRVLFSVHDRGTETADKAFVDQVNKRVYSKDRAAVTVLGAPGYFGTDGTRLAAVAFARGPYAFEIVLTTLTESPAQMRSTALKLAESFRIP